MSESDPPVDHDLDAQSVVEQGAGQAPADVVLTVDVLLGVLAATLIVFGSFGAWVDAGLITLSGVKGDGIITLVIGVAALLNVASGRWRGLVLGFGVLATVFAVYEISRIAALGSDEGFLPITVGWGLIAVCVGAFGLVAWALNHLARRADARSAIAAGTIALSIIVVTVVLGAAGTFGETSEVAKKPSAGETVVSAAESQDKPAPSATAATTPGAKLQIGEQARLHGADGVEVVATLERVTDPLNGGEFDEPTSGNRYVGVELRLTNTGDTTYDDSPGNGAVLTYGDDRQAKTSIVSGGQCSGGFASSAKISAGGRRKGCIVFEVPVANTIKTFQLSLDSGFADESADWNVRPADGSGKHSRTPVAAAAVDSGSDSSAGASGGSHSCDQNISAGGGTTCQFANDVFRAYAAAVQSGSSSSTSVSAYSEGAGQSISMDCGFGGTQVTCVGGASATVTFPKWAADVY